MFLCNVDCGVRLIGIIKIYYTGGNFFTSGSLAAILGKISTSQKGWRVRDETALREAETPLAKSERWSLGEDIGAN